MPGFATPRKRRVAIVGSIGLIVLVLIGIVACGESTTASPTSTQTSARNTGSASATTAPGNPHAAQSTVTSAIIPYRKPLDPAHVAVWRVVTTQKVVALTFDDGPSPYTPAVMAALEESHAPATFFCIGQRAAEDPASIVRLKAAGFEVENHSWDHAMQTRLSYDAIRQEITKTEEVLGPTKYSRPPDGYYNPTVREAVASLGMLLVRYDVDSRDWQHQHVAAILQRIETLVRPGSIILMHDGGGDRSQTAAAVPLVISWLRSHGYTLLTVDQLLTGGYGPTVGHS